MQPHLITRHDIRAMRSHDLRITRCHVDLTTPVAAKYLRDWKEDEPTPAAAMAVPVAWRAGL